MESLVSGGKKRRATRSGNKGDAVRARKNRRTKPLVSRNNAGKNWTLCSLCNKRVESGTLQRHQGQCRRLQREREIEDNQAKNGWIYEPLDDDDDDDDCDSNGGDPGFVGPEDATELSNELMVQEEKTGEGNVPLVVKVSNYAGNWMTFLGGSGNEEAEEFIVDEDDEEDEEPEKNVGAGETETQMQVPWDIEEDPCAAARQIGLDQQRMMVEFSNISRRGEYELEEQWCGQLPTGGAMPATPLATVLEDANHRNTLGRCYKVPEQRPAKILDDGEISMLRLIDYCQRTSSAENRGFIDGLLDILVEEMDLNGFDPRKRKKRDVVSKKVMQVFGAGCEPTIYHLSVATENRLIVLQEETVSQDARKGVQDDDSSLIGIDKDQLKQSDIYRAVPQQIDNRERHIVNVISFSARNMILDLLSDGRIFGDLKNLVVNQSNPFLPYENSTGKALELLDGTWYRDTIARLRDCKDDPLEDGVEFVLPIVMYVDKTGTSINQRYPLEPFIFTTPVICRSVRNHPDSWRPLGFIPDLEAKSSAEKKVINDSNKGHTAQAYHAALEQLLQGMKEVQDAGIVHWLRLGNHQKKVRIRPEVACIIQDGKSADMITLRVPSFHSSRRISRCCQTLQSECDQPTKTCQFIELNGTMEELFRLVGMSEKEIQEDEKYVDSGTKPTEEEAKRILAETKRQLNGLSFHPARNAFVASKIRFGKDPRSVWGATPVDLMHAFQSGIVMYLVKMILDKLPPKKQAALDRHVHKLFHGLRSKERASYPRLNFSKGYSKLTMLTSDEWPGKLFVLLIVLHTSDGRSLFKNTFDEANDVDLPEDWLDDGASKLGHAKTLEGWSMLRDKSKEEAGEAVDYRVTPMTPEQEKALLAEEKRQKEQARRQAEEPEEMEVKCSGNDFTELTEALLCFHAWYKFGHSDIGPDGKVDTRTTRESVAKMLAMVRWFCPRKKGCGWKIQKFHDLLHLANDMERFGSSKNFDAGIMESQLRSWAKRPAKTAQTRGYNTFSKQVGVRTYENQSFSRALRVHGVNGVGSLPAHENGEARKDASANKMTTGVGRHKAILGGTTYRVYATQPPSSRSDKDTGGAGLAVFEQTKALRKKRTKSVFAVSPVIETFLRFQKKPEREDIPLQREQDKMFWELKTELTFTLANGGEVTSIRCHPNYMDDGPWHDWIMVHFQVDPKDFEPYENETQFKRNIVPCKVLAVAANPKDPADVRVLVHGCHFRTKNSDIEQDTVLLEKWCLAYHDVKGDLPKLQGKKNRESYKVPHLCWIELDAIVCRCLVVEEEPGIFETVPTHPTSKKELNKVLLVRKRNKWIDEF